MTVTVRCQCGASLVAPAGAPSVLCTSCGRTVVVPEAAQLGLADTMAMAVTHLPPESGGIDPAGRTAVAPAQVPSPPVLAPPRLTPPVQLATADTEQAPARRAPAQLATADTEQAAARAMPAAPPRRRGALVVLVIGIVVGAGVAGVVVYATRGGAPDTPATTSPRTAAGAPDAAPPPGAPATATPEQLVLAEHLAIARGGAPELAALLAPDAFGFGCDADEVGYGAAQLAGFLDQDLGPRPAAGHTVTPVFTRISTDGDVAWIADEFDVAGRRFTTSQLAVRAGGRWRVAAWHWGNLLTNKAAYDLAKARRLPSPAPVRDARDAGGALDASFRAAFASRRGFIAAFSDGPDAIDLGSAPGERVIGGGAVKGAFRSVRSELRIYDGVSVGLVTDRAGWGAANVDYWMTIDGAVVTQTFRVLAVLVKERTGWRIVLAQWTNGGPAPTP